MFYSGVDNNATGVPLSTIVAAGENCYTANHIVSSTDITLTFNMTDGKLTGIVFSSTNEGMQNRYGGTYNAPPAP